MELDKLHVFDDTFGAIDHGYTVSGCNLGVGGGGIDGTCSAGCHEGDTTQIGVDLLGLGVEDIRSVTLDIGCTASDTHTKVVLGDDLDGKMVLQHLDLRVGTHGCHQSALDLRTGVIGMMQDTELGVSAFAVEVKRTVVFLIEVNTPLDEFLDTSRCVAYDLFYCCRVTEPVTRHHRIVDMFVEVIDQEIRYGCDTSLCFGGVGLLEGGLAAEGNLVLTGARYLKRKTHTGYTAANNQKIVFLYHVFMLCITQRLKIVHL